MTRGASSPSVARTREELAAGLARLRRDSARLGLVPTMGALHEGHLSLVDRSRELCDTTVASIFVNPLQFGAGEDLEHYPRDLEADLARLAERGVDLVFAPPLEVVYPRGEPEVTVDPGPMGDRLCGPFRPGHFRGVLTVVAKLFGLVRPDLAVFGRKDFQQSVLIRRMVDDLELAVEIVTAPVIREADGLAMSSRNLYLSEAERAEAPGLFRALSAVRARFLSGERSVEVLLEAAREVLAAHPSLDPQYLALVEPASLSTPDPVDGQTVVLGAVVCGTTRLIDNLALGADVPDGTGGVRSEATDSREPAGA